MIGATFVCIDLISYSLCKWVCPWRFCRTLWSSVMTLGWIFINDNQIYLLLSKLQFDIDIHIYFNVLDFISCCNWPIDSQNTRETAHAVRKLALAKAKRYLEDVMAHKQAIPFRRFCRGVGRTAQAKNRHSNGQGRWPFKSAKFILDLLKNAESNAEVCFIIAGF